MYTLLLSIIYLAFISLGLLDSLLVSVNLFAIAGLVIIGLGAAPVYPCIIHSTPENFGRENSQALVGIQMSSAYTGCTLAPPVFGLIAQYVTIKLYPFCLLAAVILMLMMTSLMNKAISGKNK